MEILLNLAILPAGYVRKCVKLNAIKIWYEEEEEYQLVKFLQLQTAWCLHWRKRKTSQPENYSVYEVFALENLLIHPNYEELLHISCI